MCYTVFIIIVDWGIFMEKKFIAFLLTGVITFTGIRVNVSAAEVTVSEQTEENIDTIYEDFSSETDSNLPQNSDDTADISIDEESGDDIFSTDEIAIEDSDEDNISVKDGTQAGSTDDTPVSSTGDSISSYANTAESEFDEPSTEDTGIVIINADGDPIKDADDKIIYYKTLQDAIDAIPEYSESNPNATTIQLRKSIVLDKTTRIINKRINIQAVGNISITRDSDDNFKDCMINVVGKDGQLQFFADASSDSSLTISGLPTSDKVEIIDVFDATFALNSGVTLKDNDYTAGGSAITCHNGTLVLAGGNITGYLGGMGAIYSNTDVYVEGSLNINTDNDNGSGIYLAKNAKLIIFGALTGKISFVHADERDGLEVITAGNNICTEEFQSSLKNVSYKNTSKYDLSAGHLSVFLKRKQTEDPVTPSTPDYDYTLRYNTNSVKWKSHSSLNAQYTATADCEWSYFFVDSNASSNTITATYNALKNTLKFTSVHANVPFMVSVDNVPETDSKLIVVTRLSTSANRVKALVLNLSKASIKNSRPPKAEQIPSIRPARTYKVTESTVTGLEEPLKFYPGATYSFTVTGAGQNDSAPFIAGDERWIPTYWTLSPDNSADKHTSWKISSAKGFSEKKTFSMYIYFNKQVYDGKQWDDNGNVEYKEISFTSQEYHEEELPTYTVNLPKTKPNLSITSIVLHIRQSTTAVKVTNTNAVFKVIGWFSDNTSIAKVSKTGKITAGKKSGQTYITVIMSNGTSKKIKVKVQAGTVKTKSISGIKRKVTLSRKKTLKLKPKLSPVTSQEKITYSSSNPKVASVSSKGVIKAKKRGTAKISIKSGNAKVICKITVK